MAMGRPGTNVRVCCTLLLAACATACSRHPVTPPASPEERLIRNDVAAQTGALPESISVTAPLNDIGIPDRDAMEFIYGLEDTLKVRIPRDQLKAAPGDTRGISERLTIRDLAALIVQSRAATAPPAPG